MIETDQVIQIDPKGNKTFLPRGAWEASVKIGDRTARLMAALGLLVGLGGSGIGAVGLYVAFQDRQPAIEGIDPEIQRQLDLNMIGDCNNERILRNALGAPDVTLEECVAEREEWIRNQ